MDKTYIEEHNIDGKYLRGKLSPEESSAFEEYLLDDGDMLEQVELDSVIFKHSTEAFEEISSKQKNKKWSGFFQIVCGMAAGALLMAFLPNLLTINNNMLDNFGIAQIEYFDETRSVSSDPTNARTIHLENGAHNLVLVIDTGGISRQEYDIEIRAGSEKGQMVSSKRNVTVSLSGELIVDLPVERLPDETYHIVLYQSASSKAKKQYNVNIVRNIH